MRRCSSRASAAANCNRSRPVPSRHLRRPPPGHACRTFGFRCFPRRRPPGLTWSWAASTSFRSESIMTARRRPRAKCRLELTRRRRPSGDRPSAVPRCRREFADNRVAMALPANKKRLGRLATLHSADWRAAEPLPPIDLPVRLASGPVIEFTANSWVEQQYLHKAEKIGLFRVRCASATSSATGSISARPGRPGCGSTPGPTAPSRGRCSSPATTNNTPWSVRARRGRRGRR